MTSPAPAPEFKATTRDTVSLQTLLDADKKTPLSVVAAGETSTSERARMEWQLLADTPGGRRLIRMHIRIKTKQKNTKS